MGTTRSRVAARAALATALALALVVSARPPAGAAPGAWQTESIPAQDGLGPLTRSFDSLGDGLLTWLGDPAARTPPVWWSGSSVRRPAGTWSQGPVLPLNDEASQLYLYGSGRAMLIGTLPDTTTSNGVQVVYADGSADGTLGPVQVLDHSQASSPVAAVDSSGDAIIAWAHAPAWDTFERSFKVVERTAASGLEAPITLGTPTPVSGAATVAINARGDQVLAWVGGRNLYARLRSPRGAWGPAAIVARLPKQPAPSKSGKWAIWAKAAISPSGMTVVAWDAADWAPNSGDYTEGAGCGNCSSLVRDGVAVHTAAHGWRSWVFERSTVDDGSVYLGAPPIVPLVDSSGKVSVTWTGGRNGAPVVKLAPLTADGIGPKTPLSGAGHRALLTDAVAGPANALLVEWTDVSEGSRNPIYVSLRRGEGPFEPEVALQSAALASKIAFQPLTGEAIVVTRGLTPPDLVAYVNSPS